MSKFVELVSFCLVAVAFGARVKARRFADYEHARGTELEVKNPKDDIDLQNPKPSVDEGEMGEMRDFIDNDEEIQRMLSEELNKEEVDPDFKLVEPDFKSVDPALVEDEDVDDPEEVLEEDENVPEVVPDPSSYPKGTWEVMLVRHGESINNIISQSKSPSRYLKEGQWIFDQNLAIEGTSPGQDVIDKNFPKALWNAKRGIIDEGSAGRDTPLSFRGEKSAHDVRDHLFPLLADGKRGDTYGLLTGAERYEAVYVSPLRRTIATAIAVFGAKAAEYGGGDAGTGATDDRIKFTAAPWTHEQSKSVSDLGHNTSILRQFTIKYAQYDKLGGSEIHNVPISSLLMSLYDVPSKWSTTHQPEADPSGLTYYPLKETCVAKKGQSSYFGDYSGCDKYNATVCKRDHSSKCDVKSKPRYESKKMLCHRIRRLEKWITTLPEKKIIIVTHSAIIRHLFDRFLQGRKPENIGMFMGTLQSDGGSALPYWKDIKTFRSTVQNPDSAEAKKIPAFRPDSDEKEFTKKLLKKRVTSNKGWCPFHLTMFAAGPIKGQKCPNNEHRGTCRMRELGVTLEGYLVRSANYDDEATHHETMMSLVGSEICISQKGKHSPPAAARRCDGPIGTAWAKLSGFEGEIDMEKPISAMFKEPAGNSLVRLHFETDTNKAVAFLFKVQEKFAKRDTQTRRFATWGKLPGEV